jgi:hypothetical protein
MRVPLIYDDTKMRPILKATVEHPERVMVALSKAQLVGVIEALDYIGLGSTELEEAYRDLTGETFFECYAEDASDE